jgi:16S rRNA (guanine(527)-N(7))-methyltransferase RsmG
VAQIITDHFQDSLSITQFIDIAAQKGLCDIGTGGGFPGIPLKIMYPQLPMVLIEVNNKKITFLKEVIQALGLQDIELYRLDWRTFVRKTKYKLDLFCARASLRPDELIRMFTEATSSYKKAQLVYWASRHWELDMVEKPFFEKEERYVVGDKQRKLVFFNMK